ncbi:GATA zinc finger domain-containing protein 15-like [Anastrepha obliqua]|uniref:GATA zinc finger domain-containing protein 15-like n=1 Tax=Anastrepha obliqua TaxID=95512 RepID=UPI00240993C6|nr:GATA zinc finger domain-containing protein 15-like [Anastrepha obliqua]
MDPASRGMRGGEWRGNNNNNNKRMTWTREMNINVMRCYYKSTNIETNKTGYREDLHRLFVEIYPQYANITQQRVVDQKRTIVTNNRLTAVELQNIKEEIAKELQSGSQDNNNNSAIESQLETNNPNNTAQHSEHIEIQNNNTNDNNTPTLQTTLINNNNCNNNKNNNEENIAINKYEKELQEQLIKWQDIEPENKYQLPKLKFNRNTKHLISNINSVLEHLH